MTGSIICGVDDSNSAKGAARVARTLSARLGLRLVVVRVVASGADRPLADRRAAQHEPGSGERGAPSIAGGILRFSLGGGGRR